MIRSLKTKTLSLLFTAMLTFPCFSAGKERIKHWDELVNNSQFTELRLAQATTLNPHEINWLAQKVAQTKHPLLIFLHLQERFNKKNITIEELPTLGNLILEAAFWAGRDAEYLRLSEGAQAYAQAQNTHRLLRTLTFKLFTEEYLTLLEQMIPFEKIIADFLDQIQFKNVVSFGRDSNPRWLINIQQKPGWIGYYDDIIITNPPAYKPQECKDFRELEFYKTLFALSQKELKTWKDFFTAKQITTPFPELGKTSSLTKEERAIIQGLKQLTEQANRTRKSAPGPIKQAAPKEDLEEWVLTTLKNFTADEA